MNFRGIRKVNENIVDNGRSLIFTEKNISKYSWADIPDGALFVDSKTGEIKQKLEGESDWVPFNSKVDGTICISKDHLIINEIFTVVTIDDGNDNNGVPLDTFTYKDENGDYHHGQKTPEGYYVFELNDGVYANKRNNLRVVIDDCLLRTPKSGVIELSENRFALTDNLIVGMKISAEYLRIFKIGAPYPRIFIANDTPLVSDIGDFWVNIGGNQHDNDDSQSGFIDWYTICNTPSSLAGYGITDKVSYEGHKHRSNEILDLPATFPANGGTSTYANKLSNGRSITLSGDATGSVVFDGSKDVTISVSVNGANISAQKAKDSDCLGGKTLADIESEISKSKADVSVISGFIYNDGFLPIPTGYSKGNCSFSIIDTSSNGNAILKDGYVSNVNEPINYLVIGVK